MKITINGVKCDYHGHRGGGTPVLTYDGAVAIAGKDAGRAYTVTYAMPAGSSRRDGSLAAGERVPLEDGMVVNVADTSNA